MTVTMIDSPARLQSFFDDIAADFSRLNFLPLMREELGLLADAHDYYFQTSTGPDGNRWQENATATIEAKGHSRVLRGHPKNKFRLSQSLTRKTATADAIREVIKTDVETIAVFGTNVEYSRYHNEPDGRLPWRPHIGIPGSYFDRFCGRVMDAAITLLKGAA